jgi:putative transposase
VSGRGRLVRLDEAARAYRTALELEPPAAERRYIQRRLAAKVARAHRKVRHARADFLHRASTRLVRASDLIVIEDLNVAGMVRNRHLARAIADCGWVSSAASWRTSASGTAASWS